MIYCTNCGQQLLDGAKFCANCGMQIGSSDTQRSDKYISEIDKTSNYGENLSGFVVECPVCGYEFRGTIPFSSIEDFSDRLEKAKNEEQRAALVRNFPIPNNKEDIFEFLVLASISITEEKYKVVFEAWIIKFEMCYQKAKMVIRNDDDFENIQKIYEQTTKSIKKAKVKHNIKSAGELISGYFEFMPSPIFGIMVILMGTIIVKKLFKGNLREVDIIFDALILWATYKLTNKKD